MLGLKLNHVVKGAPSVECHYMASIHYKCENQPSSRRHISDPRQDLGLMGTFEAPLGPLWENDQASAYLGPRGFHMDFRSWKSAQRSLFEVKKGPKIWPLGAHIFTHLWNFLQNERKTGTRGGSDLILALFGIKMARKYVPGVIIYMHWKVPLICLWPRLHGLTVKSFWENDQTPPKIQFWPIFDDQKLIEKIEAKKKNQNYNFSDFWPTLLCTL